MPKFFANKSQFTPSKTDLENGLQPVESITGVLASVSIRPGNSSSGFWLVFRVKKDYGYTDVYFDALNTVEPEIERYEIFRGKVVTIRSANERPDLDTAGSESEETVRACLLKGVASGNIKMEDLPILLDVAKGRDVPFEKWDLFKRQVENEGLAKVKEDLAKEADEYKGAIDHEKVQVSQLKELLDQVDAEKEKMLEELFSALMFLQGEEHLKGNEFGFTTANRPENLVSVGDGYNRLIAAFEKFRTKKGVYVVCEDKIFLVHDAYLEKGGRAFLLGAPKTFSRTKTEEIKQLIDKFFSFHFPPGSSD